MTKLKNIFIGTTIGAGVVGLFAYIFTMKRMSDQLEATAKAMLHSIDLKGITLRVDVKLKNPVKSTLKIKYPFVKLLLKGNVIGTSQVIDKDISIPSNGEASINAIMINIPPMSLLNIGGGLLDLVRNNKPVDITVKTITTLDLGWKQIPYEKTDSSTIKPLAKNNPNSTK